MSRRYLLAVGVTGLILGVAHAFRPYLTDKDLFMPALVAVMLAGLAGGRGPALFGVGLSMCTVAYWCAETNGALVLTPVDWAYLGEYLVLAVLSGLVAARSHEVQTSARQTAAQLQALQDSMPAGMAFVDLQGRYLRVNRVLAQLNGRSVESHVGRRVEDTMPPHLIEERRRLIEQLIHTGEPVLDAPFSLSSPDKPESERHWLRSYFPVRLDNELIGTAVALFEVTDLRQAEEAYRQKAEELRLLCETLPVMIWRIDPAGDTSYLNASAKRYFGMDSDPHSRSDWLSHIHPGDAEAVNQCWDEAVNSRAPYVLEARLRRASDDVYRWHLLQAAPLKDARGRVLEWLGTSTDIHDQKETIAERDALILQWRKAEEKARQTATEFRLLADMVPYIIWTIETTTFTTYLNQRGVTYLGLSAGELPPGGWVPFIHPEDVATASDQWKISARERTPYEVEVRLLRHDGVYRWHQLRGTPARDRIGGGTRWIGAGIDIDDQKHAIQIREAYLATASHDLKTPITALLLQLYILKRQVGALEPDLVQRIDTATGHAEQLTQLANNLLNVSRIISGRFDDPQPVSLQDVVDEVVARIGLDLETVGRLAPDDSPGPVVGVWDRLHVEQILTSLLTNALKYGQGRPIRIRVGVDGDVACLDVLDQGGTLDQPVDIKAFSPLDGPNALSGHGQGLWLARHLAERMGGHVSVFSLPREGATFSVRLPLTPVGPD